MHNGLSLYARRSIIVSSIGSFIIGIILMSSVVCYQRLSHKTEKLYLSRTIRQWEARVESLEEEKKELHALIMDMQSKYELLTTFVDSGFKTNSVEDIRNLLNEAEKLPFGTPFRNGHKVTSSYGVYTINQFGWTGVNHPGIDLIPLDGDYTIYTPVDGIITNFGFSEVWGKWIEVTTEAGYQLFFAHLDVIYYQTNDGKGNWSLELGTKIERGRRIGQMGMTGRYATGPHLHYEIRVKNETGSWVTLDPKSIIAYTGATE